MLWLQILWLQIGGDDLPPLTSTPASPRHKYGTHQRGGSPGSPRGPPQRRRRAPASFVFSRGSSPEKAASPRFRLPTALVPAVLASSGRANASASPASLLHLYHAGDDRRTRGGDEQTTATNPARGGDQIGRRRNQGLGHGNIWSSDAGYRRVAGWVVPFLPPEDGAAPIAADRRRSASSRRPPPARRPPSSSAPAASASAAASDQAVAVRPSRDAG